jgi:hypothetical protein
MRGFPHSSDPEKKVKGELWAGVTPSGRSPVTWAPMKGVLGAVKPRVEGLVSSDIKPNETQTPSKTFKSIQASTTKHIAVKRCTIKPSLKTHHY